MNDHPATREDLDRLERRLTAKLESLIPPKPVFSTAETLLFFTACAIAGVGLGILVAEAIKKIFRIS